jgi:DNA-binding MarR family transcriptional regulator
VTDAETKRAARDAWTIMSSLVLDNERRNEVSEAVGMPFSRVRALWRLATSPRTLSELAAALSMDPPNCIPLVDDLEQRGLVERRPHATDRRSKLLVATKQGIRLSNKARRLWDRPPSALQDLAPAEIKMLADILRPLNAAGHETPANARPPRRGTRARRPDARD